MAGIDFKTPFDDDSHTLHDGPLQRFFRMRKWMFATSAALLLLDRGWWNFEKTVEAVALDGLPKQTLHAGLTFAGIYLLAQGVIVGLQIAGTYLHSLHVRSELIRFPGQMSMEQQLKDAAAELKAVDRDLNKTLPVTAEHARLTALSQRLERDIAMYERAGALANRTYGPLKKVTVVSEIVLDLMRLLPMPILLAVAVVLHGKFEGVL